MPQSANIAHKVFIAAFILIISLPLIGVFFGFKSGSTPHENRKITTRLKSEISPSSSNQGFLASTKSLYLRSVRLIKSFDTYFSRTFSFRSDLLKLYTYLKSNVLNTNPLPEKVVLGTDGWYFLGDNYSNDIKESKGLENLSETDLDITIKAIEERNKYLAKKAIRFYLAVAPNKLSVYGDYLSIKKANKKTILEQLASSGSNFSLIDMKEDFPAVPSTRLFYKTDSHWNDLGAFLGYRSLMKKVKNDFPSLQVLEESDISIDSAVSFQQDLTAMLGLKLKESILKVQLKNRGRAMLQEKELKVPKNYDRNPSDYETRYRSDVNTLKLLVFHDSFGPYLVQYMRESAGESVFIWRAEFDTDVVEKEKPDVVIQVIVERNLESLKR